MLLASWVLSAVEAMVLHPGDGQASKPRGVAEGRAT